MVVVLFTSLYFIKLYKEEVLEERGHLFAIILQSLALFVLGCSLLAIVYGPEPKKSFTLGGITSGNGNAMATLTLTSKIVQTLQVSIFQGCGAFTFPLPLDDGDSYLVTLAVVPPSALQTAVGAPVSTCTLQGPVAGTISGQITTLIISCTTTAQYSVGGTITGMYTDSWWNFSDYYCCLVLFLQLCVVSFSSSSL